MCYLTLIIRVQIIQIMRFESSGSVCSIIVLLLLFCFSEQLSKHKKQIQDTVLEANHFFSRTEKKAIYNITKVELNKPLVLLLKDMENDQGKITNLQVISLAQDNDQQVVVCHFKDPTDLCIISQVKSPDIRMNIICSDLPCSVTWVIYQPEPISPSNKQAAQNLYSLKESSAHLLGEITCNDPAVTSLDGDTTIYSTSRYTRAYLNNVIYVMFTNEEKGFVYVNIQDRSRACAEISYYSVPEVLAVGESYVKDFVLKDSFSTFQIVEVPKGDFRVECSLSKIDVNMEVRPNVWVTLYGVNANGSEIVAGQNVKAVSKTTVSDFSFVFKQVNGYEKLRLVILSESNQMVVINLRLVAEETQVVELGEAIYFNLKKGEKISYKIEGDADAGEEEKIYIVRKKQEEITVSQTECQAKVDCLFTVEAVGDTANMLYISGKDLGSAMINKQGKGSYEFQEVEYITVKGQAKHYLRMGDSVYYKKAVKKDKAFQVMINNPNAIIYAAAAQKCEVPSFRCRERTANYHHPLNYVPEQDGDFLIAVEGLDNGEFVLSFVEDEDEFIPLEDGLPFSYTMDSAENRIDFKFAIKEKTDVNFNLIAPLNTLKLIVANEEKNIPDEGSAEQSSEGYVLFEKDQINGLNFVISVVKANEDSDYFTHFTLVASTLGFSLRLEPTVNYYETLSPTMVKDFVFEFDPSQNCILSVYVYNQKEKAVNLQMKLWAEGKVDDVETVTVDKEADYIDLKQIAGSLCYDEGVESCEIFLRITNVMEVEVDLSLTLLMANAIVELKDGFWQAYPEIYTTATVNFYFYPRHPAKNIFLYYHSSQTHLKLAYRLWKYEKEDINPSTWPFPLHIAEEEKEQANYKPSNYIEIDREQLEKCWPNCVMLVSLYRQNLVPLMLNPNSQQSAQFKIMVSNNQVQLPQKQKLSFSLGRGEDKDIFIDLKYLMESEYIKFYTTSTIGICNVRANLFEKGQNNCPSEDSQTDFLIFKGQSAIMLSEIREKMQNSQIAEGKEVNLCVGVHSQTSCKMTIEYSSESDRFKKIQSDTFEEIILMANEVKLFRVDGYIEQFAKITRLNGFPFVAIKKCPTLEELKQCEDSFVASEDKGKQIVVKTEAFDDQPCGECTFLFKFSTNEPSQVNFHLQSKMGEIELKENSILSDFLNEAEVNRYVIHSEAKEEIIINIHVQEGEVEAQVLDFGSLNVTKTSSAEHKILHFVIKASTEENEVGSGSKALLNPYALSRDFSVHHLSVKSVVSAKAASYNVVYSSGKRETNLQDGLILDYILEPNKQTLFYYVNEQASSHIYFSLTMPHVQMLTKLILKVYYYEDINDENTRKEFKVDKPPMSKKAPNPTLLLSLPQANYFKIALTTPSSEEEKVSLGINHQQVILLPFSHEFPFQLHVKEEINILVDVNIPGYLELSIKKCDKSEPAFGYTFDYDSFIKNEFMYSSTLNEQPHFDYLIKAQRIGTLYLNFKANSQQDSLLAVKISYSEQKSKEKLKINRRGGIVYELSNERTAKVTFPTVDCASKPCSGVSYYYMSSGVEQELYSQLVCSSSFFTQPGVVSTSPLQLHQITGKEVEGHIAFNYEMADKVSYLGIKAVSKTGEEVYYSPIEIATLFGKWSTVNFVHKATMVGVLVVVVCGLAICVRRSARQGYRPLEQLPE